MSTTFKRKVIDWCVVSAILLAVASLLLSPGLSNSVLPDGPEVVFDHSDSLDGKDHRGTPDTLYKIAAHAHTLASHDDMPTLSRLRDLNLVHGGPFYSFPNGRSPPC